MDAKKELDEEWIGLIRTSKKVGMAKKEVLAFLKENPYHSDNKNNTHRKERVYSFYFLKRQTGYILWKSPLCFLDSYEPVQATRLLFRLDDE